MRPLAIVDLDGVVADVRHRLHHLDRRPKDWRGFFLAAADGPPHPEGVAVVRTLAATCDVLFLTGRPAETAEATRTWLEAQGLGGHPVVHRPAGDHRPAAVVKVELLARLAEGRPVHVVVDDDPDVLAAMAAAGHPTFFADWEPRSDRQAAVLHEAQEGDGAT